MDADALVELEAIKQLKYRYVRCVDLKLFDELVDLFTPDAQASYGGGAYSFDGRDAILEFLRSKMGSESLLTSHKVHQPEIELTSPTTATAIWALEDTVIATDWMITIRGAAFYFDEYVKTDGEWKIRKTGYKRVYEEMQARSDTPSLKLTASWWATDGRSEIEV